MNRSDLSTVVVAIVGLVILAARLLGLLSAVPEWIVFFIDLALVVLVVAVLAAGFLYVVGRWPKAVPGISWGLFILGAAYFIVPLLATFEFSLRIRRTGYTLDAYTSVFSDPHFQATFGYSLFIGLMTIIVGLVVVVPAAYYVRLRLPQLRPFVEFVTLLPLVIPAIVLVFGYIRLYNTSSILPLTGSALGTDILLTLAYVALALPYMYRAVDTGLRTIDVGTLTEAATIMGANQATIIFRVIFPNIIVAVLSGAFLTLAIVIGEFTIASLLNRPAFGPYMQNVGANRAFEPAALSIISFVITWGAMGMIQLLSRFAPKTAATAS